MHIAFCNKDNNLFIFVNGNLISQYSNTSSAVLYNYITLGRSYWNGSTSVGYYNEIHIVKGLAQWTSNFEVPTHEYIINRTFENENGIYAM